MRGVPPQGSFRHPDRVTIPATFREGDTHTLTHTHCQARPHTRPSVDGVPWQPAAVVQRVYLYANAGCTDSGCASPGDANAKKMRNGGAQATVAPTMT